MSQRCYPAEWVLPGHPDKLCDAIADAIVQEASARERRALCGIEVSIHMSSVFVTGRIACEGAQDIDVNALVRSVLESAGYSGAWAPDPSRLRISTRLCVGPLQDGEGDFRAVSDDQSIVTGYAIDQPGTNYLPPEHFIAFRIGQELARLRGACPELRLGPDGKLIVEYDAGSSRLRSFSASLQQAIGGSEVDLCREARGLVAATLRDISASFGGLRPELPDAFLVNGAGNFAVGGPEGDNGLSGKKLVVDAYGPRAPIGGGALSGKDFFKADRAGAILARRLAKTAVMTGAARECIATLAIFPGDREFHVVSMLDENCRDLDGARWGGMFDLSLESVGEAYTGSSDLVEVAREGHFTRPDRPWERIRL